MLTLFLLFIAHFFIGQLLEISKGKILYWLFNLLLLVLVLYFSLGVTYTSDWFMYEYFYYSDWDKTDLMFQFLRDIMKMYKLKYETFFQFHIVVSVLAYYFLISRYTKNIFYVFFIFFILYYVPYLNQIRYYFGFPFFLLSIHYLVYNRKIWLFILFTVLAVTSHSAIIVMYGFLPLYYFVKTRSFPTYIMVITIIVSLIAFVFFQMGIIEDIEHFGAYASKGYTSSVLGGIFAALPYFIYFAYILYMNQWYRKRQTDFSTDKMYTFLSKISLFSIIFIPASFFMQVLGQRYVFPFVIMWIIFILYLIRNESPRVKFLHLLAFGMVHFLAGIAMYELPNYLFGESFYEDELIKGLKSIKYIDFLFGR